LCAPTAAALCNLCERRCGVGRHSSQPGACGLGASSHVFRCYVSLAEELHLSPALMIYLAGCNLRCRFCTQAPRCYRPEEGPDLTAPDMVARIEALAPAVRWINWVGGEPSLHAANLIEVRRRLRAQTPWLLNTNGYFTRECRERIDELFDLYLVDFKFGNDACAASLAGVSGYVAVLQRNLRDIHATGPQRLLVRHLLMPGHDRCCLEPVARWVALNLPGVRFHLMNSYVPGPLVMDDPVLGRTVPLEAVARAEACCRDLGLNLVPQASSLRQTPEKPPAVYPHAWSKTELDDVQVSVGPDGRLYFHDLDADLIEVALAVNPDDAVMRRRLALCRTRPSPIQEDSP
jgi:putative pyruvate formate lyase activating enzyme